jgi:hypothetical protein
MTAVSSLSAAAKKMLEEDFYSNGCQDDPSKDLHPGAEVAAG